MNFGLPGGMKAKRFYQHCRSQGIDITMDEAANMRECWISAFTEMEKHMTVVAAAIDQKKATDKFYKMGADYEDDDEDQDDSDGAPRTCSAEAITGMFRNACTENSALNFQFQSVAAYGAKEAGWNLLRLGLGPRLVNFVHDEYLYNLWPWELRTYIPHIEAAMISGMQQAAPDVKIGVETCVMLHWDKAAVPFEKIKWDGDNPIIAEPEFVAKLLQTDT